MWYYFKSLMQQVFSQRVQVGQLICFRQQPTTRNDFYQWLKNKLTTQYALGNLGMFALECVGSELQYIFWWGVFMTINHYQIATKSSIFLNIWVQCSQELLLESKSRARDWFCNLSLNTLQSSPVLLQWSQIKLGGQVETPIKLVEVHFEVTSVKLVQKPFYHHMILHSNGPKYLN